MPLAGALPTLTSLDRLDRAIATVASRAARLVSRHPNVLSSAVVVALAGFGVTAFGIAPMAPDAADLPRRVISETVALPDLAAQTETLAEHGLSLYRTELTRTSDTADSLLRRLNVSDAQAAAFLRTDADARRIFDGRAGKSVQLRADDFGRVQEIVVRWLPEGGPKRPTDFMRLRIERGAAGLVSRVETAPLAAEVRLGSGTLRTTFFAASDDAQLPDAVANQLSEMFATEIDFHRSLRRGDTFTVLYEALTADGETLVAADGEEVTGRVLAAEIASRGRTYSAVWFDGARAPGDAPGTTRGGYFGFNGQSKRHAFLASPLTFTRITSGFEMRMHPILQTWRAHRGVDYGAPTGTPVHSVGAGTVEFAGWQNGYGNVVQVSHGNDRSTVYAHLSQIDVQKGQRVEQGAALGTVGATGWATGPHLHFEFRIKDEQQDPTAIAETSEPVVLPPSAKAQFALVAKQAREQLQAAASVAVAGRVALSE